MVIMFMTVHNIEIEDSNFDPRHKSDHSGIPHS